ncbi:pectin lyase [Pyrrhoderma noxium]|uniref:galacturonan 1,4-alpha-galacturonidase n=1 Tax=Pyrrhoderma noxium TaxID=2282107 RepID=A0A286U6D5_9AGAM|nr:pectin lyase [Pyrrhoderma noxium]
MFLTLSPSKQIYFFQDFYPRLGEQHPRLYLQETKPELQLRPLIPSELCVKFSGPEFSRVKRHMTSERTVELSVPSKPCSISPLGEGKDDSDRAVEECGNGGHIILEAGNFNITKKMYWNLTDAQVDLFGTLNFVPDIDYWLDANNTYRVVFIQSQASWFVVSGSNFVIDAHWVGGINGNGQTWWETFTTRPREDGDGRPLALTIFQAYHAVVRNFKIISQPFWCNAVANSFDVVYDGMLCNATNTNPEFFGQNIVPNTDGIDTYRSDNIKLLNWDITCGDDCLAVKGNTSNLLAQNYTCRGGNGIAFGSLGQYVGLDDIVQNVVLQDLHNIRLNSSIQPNMNHGVYFKSWTGTVNGVPPTGGGGAGGFVKNVTVKNFVLNQVSTPISLYQTNGGHSGDTPSFLQFSDLHFENFMGTATSGKLVDIECSSNAHCENITFEEFDVSPPSGDSVSLVCVNVDSESGLSAPCNATGKAN